MSYLVLPKGMPDFNKAVISFWFRVPLESIMAAAKDTFQPPTGIPAENGQPQLPAFPNLQRVIPLITFGSEGSQKRNGGVDFPSLDPLAGNPTTWSASQISNQTPSFIGLLCGLEYDDNDEVSGRASAGLIINLQMLGYGSGSGEFYTPPDNRHEPPFRKVGGLVVLENYTEELKQGLSAGTLFNEEVIHVEVPSSYSPDGGFSPNRKAPPGNIVPDQWHHVLISFDLSIPLTAQNTLQSPDPARLYDNPPPITGPKLWLAYDDINYSGGAFGTAWPQGGNFPPNSYDPNLVVPLTTFIGSMYNLDQQGYHDYGLPGTAMTYRIHYDEGPDPHGDKRIQFQFNPANPDEFSPQGGLYLDAAIQQVGGWSYSKGKIQASNHPIGVPAAAGYVDRIHHVEMAELQIFTDVTLDTKDEDNRRAFIDNKGKPVLPSKTKKLLKKRPDVLLHGSGNWQTGSNTGSTGVDDNGKRKSSGKFSPTGRIDAYKPEPSLHGPQQDKQKKDGTTGKPIP